MKLWTQLSTCQPIASHLVPIDKASYNSFSSRINMAQKGMLVYSYSMDYIHQLANSQTVGVASYSWLRHSKLKWPKQNVGIINEQKVGIIYKLTIASYRYLRCFKPDWSISKEMCWSTQVYTKEWGHNEHIQCTHTSYHKGTLVYTHDVTLFKVDVEASSYLGQVGGD